VPLMATRKPPAKGHRSARGTSRPAPPKTAVRKRARGDRGTPGKPDAVIHQVLARVDRIDHELELQSKRMAQMEQQLDELRRSLRDVTAPPSDALPPTAGRLATILGRAATRDVR